MTKKKYNYVKILVVNKDQGWMTVKHGGDVRQIQINALPIIKTLLNKIYAKQKRLYKI